MKIEESMKVINVIESIKITQTVTVGKRVALQTIANSKHFTL